MLTPLATLGPMFSNIKLKSKFSPYKTFVGAVFVASIFVLV